MNRNNRNLSLDLVKGICIILMVACHAGAPVWMCNVIYLFHMPTFFLISGYLFKEEYLSDFKLYTQKKIKGIWWPFVFWTTIYILLHNVFFFLKFYANSYSIKDALLLMAKSLVMGGTEQLLGGFWFLSALFFATMVGYIYYRWIGFSTKAIIIGILTSLVAVIALCHYNISMLTLHLNPRDFIAVAFFLTGTLYAKFDNKISAIRRNIFILTAILCLGFQSALLPTHIGILTVKTAVPFYITATISAIALIQICTLAKNTPFIRGVSKIGMRTLDILIFHMLAFKLLTSILVIIYDLPHSQLQAFPVLQLNNQWVWLLYTLSSVLISYFISELIYRIKSKKLFLKNLIP